MRIAIFCLWSTAFACPEIDSGELTQLIDLELGERAPLLTLRCLDGRTELRLGTVSRTLDLSLTPSSARARLVALAASELSSREPLRKLVATQRKNRSEAAMWKQLFAVSIVAAPL